MKKILINKDTWQTRVAVLNNERLQDIYFDTHNKEDLDRCFFKGRVSRVLPGIQTAFVDIGQQKAGFLHISEVDRALASEKIADYDDIREEMTDREIKSSLDIGKIFTVFYIFSGVGIILGFITSVANKAHERSATEDLMDKKRREMFK